MLLWSSLFGVCCDCAVTCCSSGGVICCCGIRCLVFVVTVPSLVVLVAVSFAVVVFVVWCLVVPVPSLVALL